MKTLFTRRRWIGAAVALVAGFAGFELGRHQPAPSSLPSGAAHSPGAMEAGEKPLIGIASLSSETYIRAIREAGGVPVVLPNTDGDTGGLEEYLTRLDGLLLPGGADIPPSEYGEEPHPTYRPLDNDRFQFEKALAHAWIEQTDKPMLGICLGSQWINVASGGSLVQDIPSEFGINHKDITHQVTVEPGSRLSRIFGQTEFEVNSLHHQAVREVGKRLRIAARCPDGIVEATESTDPDRFLIGVQWHPEKLLPGNQLQAKLLKAFVEAAAETRAGRSLAGGESVKAETRSGP